jgi:uncharacterized membrane protein YdbT with pleckstrin-like domain
MVLPVETDIVEGIPNRMLVVGAVVAISLILLVGVAISSELFYRGFEYDFAQDSFVVKRGILNKKEIVMPYKEIDSAKVLRSGVHALDQIFGLTCISVKAGKKSVIVPGIVEPEVFLRRLMAHVEGNDHIKNSEIYMSEREILMKLSSDIKGLHAKLEQFMTEQKASQATQRGTHDYPTEFLRTVEKDVDRLIDMKAFSEGINAEPKQPPHHERKKPRGSDKE